MKSQNKSCTARQVSSPDGTTKSWHQVRTPDAQYKLVLGFALLCSVICGYSQLSAQEYEPIELGVSVPPIQKLTIVETKLFPDINSEDFNRGYIELKDAVTLSISSNVPWRVVISAPRTNLYTTPRSVKPIDSFQWRGKTNIFQSISIEPVLAFEGSNCVKDYTCTLDYRLNLSWGSTPPGMMDIQPEFLIKPGNSSRQRMKDEG